MTARSEATSGFASRFALQLPAVLTVVVAVTASDLYFGPIGAAVVGLLVGTVAALGVSALATGSD